jgi:hypothetical protein
MDSALFAILLRDTAYLLRPIQVSEILPSSKSIEQSGNLSASYVHSHPHRNVLLALSDLHQIFGRSIHTTDNPDGIWRPNHVTHKLMFYAAHIVSTPLTVLSALSQEALIRSKVFQAETQQDLLSQKSLGG